MGMKLGLFDERTNEFYGIHTRYGGVKSLCAIIGYRTINQVDLLPEELPSSIELHYGAGNTSLFNWLEEMETKYLFLSAGVEAIVGVEVTPPELGPRVGRDINGALVLFPLSDDDYE